MQTKCEININKKGLSLPSDFLSFDQNVLEDNFKLHAMWHELGLKILTSSVVKTMQEPLIRTIPVKYSTSRFCSNWPEASMACRL